MVEIGKQIQQALAVIVVTVALLAMTPVIVDQVQGMVTTDNVYTGEFLGTPDNATTLFNFTNIPIRSASETVYQNTTVVTNYVYYPTIYTINAVNFTSAPNSLGGNITATYSDSVGWTFTGAEGAILFLGLVPFIWVAAILATSAYSMFRIAKGET